MSEGTTSPALEPEPAPLPDNDDLHREIFLRLPPRPSTLPRASLVSKRWRRLLSDPAFLRRFRAHHRAPPLLGFFAYEDGDIEFVPTLRRPDRIPGARFSMPRRDGGGGYLSFLGCRHGLALLVDLAQLEAVVWDPVTGGQRRVPFPPGFSKGHVYKGAVLSSSGDGHVHGDRHLIPFKLVLVHHTDFHSPIASACLYESESGKWGDVSSTAIPRFSRLHQPGVLVGNQVYWVLLGTSDILEFDLDGQSLAVIQKPEDAHVTNNSGIQALRTEDNKLGLATLSKLGIQLWARESNWDGVGRWVQWKSVELDKLLAISPSMRIWSATILGFDEDNNAFFICTNIGIYKIQLESIQFTRLFDGDRFTAYYPYTNFYTAGNSLQAVTPMGSSESDRPISVGVSWEFHGIKYADVAKERE